MKTMKQLMLAGVQIRIRTKHLPNISLQQFLLRIYFYKSIFIRNNPSVVYRLHIRKSYDEENGSCNNIYMFRRKVFNSKDI
jgi:hypothetical protein